jgi:hypothetical protein
LDQTIVTKACGRCGKWHTDVELIEQRRFSCTEIKRYWADIRKKHEEIYGHRALISREKNGKWICVECNGTLLEMKGDDLDTCQESE